MNRDEAREILESMTKSESLLRHSKSVELVMEEYADYFGENKEEWAICGMLHDADYELYPSEHPNKIVTLLRERGAEKIAYAISAHYSKWNNPPTNLLDKALLACDELTGFIIACSKVRPDGIVGLTVKSVLKKLKNPKFAAKVERDEIKLGVELIDIQEDKHIAFIIEALQKHKEILNI
jgi:predicted hydrolase (HD superfamily)